MDDAKTGQVSSTAAELYEEFFVPALFGQWPDRLLELVEVRPSETVLDVGCGTGVLARAARARVGPEGEVVGVDLNEGMLSVANRIATDVTWLQGPAEDLPVETASVDVVMSQFALMFFRDPARAVQEMSRVLRPGGRLVVATWAEIGASPGYDAMVQLLDRVVGPEAAQALRAPFSVGDEEAMRSVLVDVFPSVKVRRWEGVARFPSLQAWLDTDIRAWTLRDLVSDEQYQALTAEVPRELGHFRSADGQVSFAAPAMVADAVAAG